MQQQLPGMHRSIQARSSAGQQASLWHGGPSPAQTLRQLEAAVVSSMSTTLRQQQPTVSTGQPRAARCRAVASAAAAHLCRDAACAAHNALSSCSSSQHRGRGACTSRRVRAQGLRAPSPSEQQTPPQAHCQPDSQQQQQPPLAQHNLRQLLRKHLAHSSRRQQQPDPAATAALARKLTSVLRDSTSSAADIADVLLVAEDCRCLNVVHVAAALARLVRLAAAEQAAATAAAVSAAVDGEDPFAAGSAGGSSSGYGAATGLAGDEYDADGYDADSSAFAGYGGDHDEDGFMVTAVVPLLGQQQGEMRLIRSGAAGAGRRGSRWHAPPPATAAAGAGGWYDPDADAAGELEQQQHLVEQLVQAGVQLWPSLSAATITSICWALAQLQHDPPAELLQRAGAALRGMAASLLPQQQQQQQQQDLSANPRQVIILLWALAKTATDIEDIVGPQQQQQHEGQHAPSSNTRGGLLQHVLSCLTPHLPDLSSQGLLLLLWAAATWHKNSCSSSSSSSSSNGSSGGPVVPAEAAAGLLSASAAAMESQALTPRGLAVLVWSAARLRLTPDAAWLGAWLAAMQEGLPAAGPQDLATAAWGLARMGCPPPGEWLAAFTARAGAVAGHMSPRELPPLLWALAWLRYRPSAGAAHALLQQGGRLAARGSLTPQGLSLLLWSCGVLGIELPGRWVDGVLAAAAGYLPLFRPVEASGLWVALVRLQHIPPAAWLDVWWGGSAGLLGAAGGQQLALLLWCAVRLGQGPPSHWMRAWLAASQGAMSRGEVTARGYGLIWDALGQTAPTGLVPSEEWLSTYFTASMQPPVLGELSDLTLDKSLAGLAAVDARLQAGLDLPQDWVQATQAASLQLLQGAKLVSVASILQAAGQLALPLSPVWLAAAMARLQQLLGQAGFLPHTFHPHHAFAASSSSSSGSSGGGDGTNSSGSIATSSSSTNPTGRRFVRTVGGAGAGAGRRSMVLSARVARGWTRVCLQQVLFGLRAQQMLTPAAQRRLWYAARQAATAAAAAGAGGASWEAALAAAAAEGDGPVPWPGSNEDSSSSSAAGSDVLSVWPWLATAVYAVWPDKQSAQQALATLER